MSIKVGSALFALTIYHMASQVSNYSLDPSTTK